MADKSIIIDTSLNTSGFEKGLIELNGSMEKQAKNILNQFNFLSISINNSIENTVSESEKKVDESSKSIKSKLGELASSSFKVLKEKLTEILPSFEDIAKKVIDFGDQYKSACNTLQTNIGATKEEMQGVGQAIKEVYADNFGKDMQDIAGSMSIVQQYLKDTGEDIKGVTENAIGFRDTFGVDVPQSMQSVDILMKQFGITSDEAFNLMAQGQQKGLDFGENLISNISTYSEEFSKAGLSAEDMFNIMANSGESGVGNLDKICEAAKTLTNNLTDGSNSTREGLEAIGLNADEVSSKMSQGGDTAKQTFSEVVESLANMDDKQAQNIAGANLFGEKWGELGPNICMQLAGINGDFDQTKNTMDQINEIKYDTFGEAISGIGRQLETTFLLPIAEKVLPYLNDMANSMKDAFASDEISSSVDALGDSIGNVIETISGIVEEWLPKIIEGLSWLLEHSSEISAGIAGIGTALEVFKATEFIKSIIKDFKDAKDAEEGLTIAQWLMNAAMDANPIGIVIAIIAGLVAAVVMLWNTNEGFREAVINAWNAIKECGADVWEGICTFFTETIPEAFNTLIEFFTETVPEFFTGLWETVCQLCSDGWNLVIEFFTESIPAFFEMLAEWFNQLPEKLGELIGFILGSIVNFGAQILEWITTNIPIIIESIVTFISELPEKIWTWLLAVINKFSEWGTNIINWITTNIPAIIENIVTFISELPEKIWTWLLAAIDKFSEWGTNIISWITTNVPNWINNIVTFFSELPGKIWTWFENTISKVVEWGSNMVSKAQEGMTNMSTAIMEAVKGIPEKMLEVGSNIVKGIWNGISNSINWIKDKISDFCSGIVVGFKDALDIHSPSRIMRDLIGINIVKGIGIGVDLETPNLEKDINANIADLTSRLQATVNYETAKTTAEIVSNTNKESGVKSNTNTKTTNNNGPLLNIENFSNNTDYDIKELSEQLAFYIKRDL